MEKEKNFFLVNLDLRVNIWMGDIGMENTKNINMEN